MDWVIETLVVIVGGVAFGAWSIVVAVVFNWSLPEVEDEDWDAASYYGDEFVESDGSPRADIGAVLRFGTLHCERDQSQRANRSSRILAAGRPGTRDH
ncbi:hypothetical protein [Stieleria varia]|nr:hypothetical protein [Stieleria varia]